MFFRPMLPDVSMANTMSEPLEQSADDSYNQGVFRRGIIVLAPLNENFVVYKGKHWVLPVQNVTYPASYY